MSPKVSPPATIIFSPDGTALPEAFDSWLAAQRSQVLGVATGDGLMAIALRSIALRSLSACMRLKTDSYTCVVPAIVLCAEGVGRVRLPSTRERTRRSFPVSMIAKVSGGLKPSSRDHTETLACTRLPDFRERVRSKPKFRDGSSFLIQL
ncbi:MAG: hypothetical protein ABJC63_03060 [Gemmatimonadales bacterium]